METDIAQVGGTEQCIAYSVNEHVGIGVTHRPFARSGQLYTAEKKVATFLELMHIKTHSYTNLHNVF
jgi:fructose-1,6-bisphosphatase/inositol monophosphatase family enzyme